MEDEIIAQIKNNDLAFLETTNIDYVFTDRTLLIHKACLYNNIDLLLYLINRGIDLNSQAGRYLNTPLNFSIYNECVEISYILLELGADPNAINNMGFTFPLLCIKFNNVLGFILYFVYEDCKRIDGKNECICQYSFRKNKYRFVQVINKLIKENIIKCRTIRLRKEKKKKKNTLLNNLEILTCKRVLRLPLFLIAIFLFIYFNYPNVCLIFLVSLIISQRREVINSNFYVFLSVFYTFDYVYRLVLMSPYSLLIAIPYILVFLKLLLYKPKYRHNNFNECKILIKDLIKHEKYNMVQFCYICWIEKEKNTVHCHYCKTCIYNFDHHCKFLGTCVDGETTRLFNIYLLLKIGLFIFISNIKVGQSYQMHYKALLLFVMFQTFQRFD